MKQLIVILILSLAIAGPVMAQSNDKPIQLALIAPAQIYSETNSITGFRINFLYGKNTSVTGVDLGLINHVTSGKTSGVQWGLVGIADDEFLGIQENWINISKKDFKGIQCGIFNSANSARGWQFGLVNYAQSLHGIQIGLVNIIKTGGQFPVFPIVNWSF
jgi:hypothetical protein